MKFRFQNFQKVGFEDVLADKKEEFLEVSLSAKAFKTFWVLFGFLCLLIFFRLLVFGLSKDEFKKEALSNVEQVVILPAERGVIFDRFNKPLVNNKVQELASGELRFSREYQKPRVFSHILGYLSLTTLSDFKRRAFLETEDLVGRSGLELFYDDLLRGENGRKIIFQDAQGKILGEKIISSEKGRDVFTFIDSQFQKYFYSRLKKGLAELKAEKALGLAINPLTGEVLSLISLPDFKEKEIEKFFGEPNAPFFNRASSGLYMPGSTIKPLIAIAALSEGIISPRREIFSPGYLFLIHPYTGERIYFRDWKPHGFVNLYQALARSSNVYFYTVGGGVDGFEGIGFKNLRKYFEKFGLGSLTGIDLKDEKQGILPCSQKIWRRGDVYNFSIGQGELLVTPLGLIRYISAIANRGKLLRLRLNKSRPFEVLKEINIEKKIFEEVEKGMLEAVSEPYGTAHFLSELPFRIAAKTGTAQLEDEKINAIFVGYIANKNPSLAILILIEEAEHGSLNTLPIAKDVLSWYYQNRIYKSTNNANPTNNLGSNE